MSNDKSPVSPHEQMDAFDKEGTPYSIAITFPGGREILGDVCEHGPNWILVREEGNENKQWCNISRAETVTVIL